MNLAAAVFAALAVALALMLYASHRRARSALQANRAQSDEHRRALEQCAEATRDELAATGAQLQALRSELESVRVQGQAARSESDAARTQLLAKQIELAAARAGILARDAELYRLRVFAEERALLQQEVAGARTECARYRQILVDVERQAPPPILAGGHDDLRLIVGVGPVLERLLHQMGVTTFRQIAGWSDRDIDAFDQRLAEFHGRVRRDEWVTQARELHYQKFGERLGARR